MEIYNEDDLLQIFMTKKNFIVRINIYLQWF